MQLHYEGSRLNLNRLLSEFWKHKLVNLLILFLFWGLGIFYYKTTRPVYKTTATVEIKNPLPGLDLGALNIDVEANLQTDIDILKSNVLIQKTLKKLDNFTDYRYHTTFRTINLYKNAPFRVSHFIMYNPKLYGKELLLTDLGEDRFRLTVKEGSLTRLLKSIHLLPHKQEFDLHHIFHYGKPMITKDIAFQIDKKRPFRGSGFSFVIHNPIVAAEENRKRLTVAPASFRSTILQLSYKDHNARRAKDFLNTLIRSFISYSLQDQTELEKKKLEFVNEKLALVRSKLMLSEDQLENFKISHNVTDLNLQKEEVIKKISNIRDGLQRTEINRKEILWIVRQVQRGNFAALSGIGDRYPLITELARTLQNREAEKTRLLTIYTDKHPDVISITRQIAMLKASLRESAISLKAKTDQRRSALQHDLHLYQRLLKAFPEKEKELKHYKRVYDVNDNIFNYLLKKQSELSLQNLSIMSNKKVLDYAHMPLRPISPKLGMILAISTFLALLAMLLYALLAIKRDTAIKSAEDIAEITDIPLFGMIPYVQNSALYNRAYVITDPGSPASEAFRTIRTNLDYVVTDSNSKVILVTSSVPGEGKTVVTSNLAAIIAMGEKRCILLSMDLRKPQIHQKFGLPNKFGMSDILANKMPLEKAIWKHKEYQNLHIVTSGRIPPNPYELLASQRTHELIAQLRKSYDYIIIDTPPVEYVPDAIALFKYADIHLFVVKSEFSQKKNLAALDRLIKKLKLQNNGIVLNSVKEKYLDKKYFDKRYISYDAL